MRHAGFSVRRLRFFTPIFFWPSCLRVTDAALQRRRHFTPVRSGVAVEFATASILFCRVLPLRC